MRKMKKSTGVVWWARALPLAMALTAAAAGCDDATSPSAGPQTVTLSVWMGVGAANPAPTLFAEGLELTDGVSTLVIESAELVIRELEFERIETSGCDSELDNDSCEEFEVGPFVLPLPLDGSVSTEITAQVDPGVYDEIEFEIHKPDDGDPADQNFVEENPNFADISIRVTGTFDGNPFLYTSDVNEEQEIELSDPLEVTATSGPVGVTLTLDISTWFVNSSEMLIDPSTANDGQPNESLVTDNIKNSIEGYRDDDHDGVPHGDDLDEDDDSTS